jgi:hypothetical protein
MDLEEVYPDEEVVHAGATILLEVNMLGVEQPLDELDRG